MSDTKKTRDSAARETRATPEALGQGEAMANHAAEELRDLYLDAVNHALESSTMLLQLASQTAQQAMRPLHARAGNGSARG